MDFRILGPMEVAEGERLIAVRGAKPRNLLAFLLVHANQAVSTDQLVDALWDERPPTSSTATLHTYVSSLRKDLAHDRLRTRGRAYVLEVEEDAVDALRFERAIAAVSNEASPTIVAARLAEALAWWRGPALPEFRHASWARAQAARLEELRLGAIERQMAARLGCGGHAAVVPELEALVQEHPLRERLWAQLILALYGCDRQADALRTYGRLQQRLRGELGIEPSRELQRLEASILRQDVELEWNDAVPRGSARLARDLPNPSTALVGRGADVDAVCRLVRERRLVTLTGAGGSGKTRLAIEAAQRLTPEFPDGVRFADLASVSDPGQVTDVVARALGLTADPTETDPVDRLSAYMAGRTLLCVMDNCEHVLDVCARLVEDILARSSSSRLLATSREGLGVLGEQQYVVRPLDPAGAMALFAERAGEARAGFRVDEANRDVIAQICGRLDGIPLAIELAAARIALLSPVQILERLDDHLGFVGGQGRRTARHQSLTATLDWSYDLLDPAEQATLRRLTAFPASFTFEAAEAVVGTDDTVGLLGSLVTKSLVHTLDDGERLRYGLLETVRAYADTKAVEAGDVTTGRSRQMQWVVDWLTSMPFEQRWLGDDDLISGEYPNIVSALEWSARANHPEALARVAAGVDWARSESWQVGLRWTQAAADVAAELPGALQNQLYVVLWGLGGMAIRELGDWRTRNGWAQRAVDLDGDSPIALQAVALTQLGTGLAAETGRQRLEARRLAHDARSEFVGEADRYVTIGTAMSEELAAPWQMYCRLMAGRAYTNLMAVSIRNAEAAEAHYLAGIGAASDDTQFMGLHSMLCGDLAILRLYTGDTTGARLMAREASAVGTISLAWAKEYPVGLAVAVAFESPDVARDELRKYDEAARAADWALGPETVAFYGGVAAAMREDWEAAGRLLAAGERSTLRSSATSLLYYAFRARVREAVGADRLSALRREGQSMTVADARALALDAS